MANILKYFRKGGDADQLVQRSRSEVVVVSSKPPTPRRFSQYAGSVPYESEYCSSQVPIRTENFRLLIFKESDLSERRLLFDSLSVRPRRVSDASVTSNGSAASSPGRGLPPLSSDGKFEFHRHQLDTRLISEMIFGSMAMAFKGETTKVHKFGESPMITKVFTSETSSTRAKRIFPCPVINENGATRMDSSDSDSQYSTVHSLDGILPGGSKSRSYPMDVPERVFKTPTPSFRADETDSANEDEKRPTGRVKSNSEVVRSSSAFAVHSPSSSGGSFSWRRRMANSWDKGLSQLGTASPNDEVPRSKKAQVGMAVVFDTSGGNQVSTQASFNRFLQRHMQLVELDLLKLQTAIRNALHCRSAFLGLVHEAWEDFCGAVGFLVSAPRLREPVWLSMMRYSRKRSREEQERVKAENLGGKWLSAAVRLVRSLESKEKNFFMSNLLTAVLQHHLTWVGSVMPGCNPTSSCVFGYQDRWRGSQHSNDFSETVGSGAGEPYNPHWAQYADVTGALGFPIRQAKTVVVGEEVELVESILFFLSLFIRSCDLSEAAEEDTPQPQPPTFHTHSVAESHSSTATPLRKSSRTLRRSYRNTRAAELRAAKFEVRPVTETPSLSLPKSQSEPSDMLKASRKTRKLSALAVPTAEKKMKPSESPIKGLKVMVSDEEGVNSSSGSEDQQQQSTPKASPQPKTINSLDSGIEESDAMALMEDACKTALDSVLLDEIDEEGSREASFPLPSSPDHLSSIGRSMLGGFLPHHTGGGHLALSGTLPFPELYSTLSESLHSENGPSTQQSVCIVANTTDWSVKVLKSGSWDYTLKDSEMKVPAKSVVACLENICTLNDILAAPDFCLTYVEDCLGELYSKSVVLSEVIEQERAESVELQKVVEVAGCDWSDLPLLLSVASVHSPELIASLSA